MSDYIKPRIAWVSDTIGNAFTGDVQVIAFGINDTEYYDEATRERHLAEIEQRLTGRGFKVSRSANGLGIVGRKIEPEEN